MLEILIIVIVILWLLGAVTIHLGGLVNLLVLIIVLILLWRLFVQRRL